MRRFCIAIIVALVTAGAALAQDAPKPVPLTELETLRLDHLALREAYARLAVAQDACLAERGRAHQELGNFRAALASQELTQDEAAIKKQIEDARPGFDFNPKTRTLTAKPPVNK